MRQRITHWRREDTMTYTKFTVEGRGEFPLDMLRYDSAWPYTGSDVSKIEARHDDGYSDSTDRREVTLLSAHGNLTAARWASFGWPVTSIEGVAT